MAEDIFEKLMALESLAALDKNDLGIKRKAVADTQKAAHTAPGKATLADMDAARAAYDETIGRMSARYLVDDAAPEGERFVTRKQALNWLHAQGYKVSQGKFYGDCKAGFPPLYKDGSLSKFLVMQYGQQCDVETRGVGLVPAAVDNAENEARKLKAEADIAETKAKRMLREDDRLWLHADDAWASVAALMGVLRDAIRHHLYGASREVIHLAGGDQARNNEVFEAVDGVVSRAFNDVAGDEINVEFTRVVEDGE